MSSERKRDWTFIVYPDSAPDNWQLILNKLHICFGVSPLHQADFNGDGSEKKAHWHVYLKFSGLKSYEQIKEISDSVHGSFPIPVRDPIGLIRYFIHLDNPEKAQYDPSDIKSFGGFDKFVEDAFSFKTSDINSLMNEIQDFIVERQISEYEDLWGFTAEHPQWRYVLNMYNCNSIFRLLNSIRYRKERFRRDLS